MSEPNHPRPHFHAKYAEHEASIAMDTLEILAGHLPGRSIEMVLAWAFQHRAELLAAWETIRHGGTPNKIAPLI